jgi:hypothetical protein
LSIASVLVDTGSQLALLAYQLLDPKLQDRVSYSLQHATLPSSSKAR